MIKAPYWAALAFALSLNSVVPASAQEPEEVAPSPNEIVNAAEGKDWVRISADDLLVMTLAPDRDGNERKVVIQLMPAPFSQGWVSNIRTLARAKWYDGISVNRVQDNYVVQWGDPNHDNPEAEGKAKPLPEGLKVMGEDEYIASPFPPAVEKQNAKIFDRTLERRLAGKYVSQESLQDENWHDPYAISNRAAMGWPLGLAYAPKRVWPVHCYGMVGVGRNYSPDTGSGAELYTVIGHAPRHLDRNIALVGRIVEGMEHLSSLPRGSGALGFYTKEEADKRVPILSIRVASDLPEEQRPLFEYLSTESETFAKYAEARANRRDPFFIVPAGGADICNIPVPVRRYELQD